jgi:hypothetical protein
MNHHIYLRNGVVYLPTMGMMGKGFYRGVEPVAVVSVENTEALRQALKATIARGNPTVPQPQRRDDWPRPVVLQYARVKSWPAFERGLQFWTLTKENIFQIRVQKKQPDRMWRDDPEQTITLPPGASVDDVVDRTIAILQDAARK